MPVSTVDFRPGEEALTGAEAQVNLDYAGLLQSPGLTLDVTDLSNFLSLRAFERERRRVETLQANVLEKQRLRREVALYKANAVEREAARLRAAEEQRRRQLAAGGRAAEGRGRRRGAGRKEGGRGGRSSQGRRRGRAKSRRTRKTRTCCRSIRPAA